MGYRPWMALIALLLSLSQAAAQQALAANASESTPNTTPFLVPPVRLGLVDEPESVYPQVTPPSPEEGYNAGAVNFDLSASYWTRYVYRGVDQSTKGKATENSLQFNGLAEWDLGKLPHPFIGLFANVFNNDPVSRFEEVRPMTGLEWTIKPLTFAGGYQVYLFPNRRSLDTQEAWGRVTLDDSRLWRSEKPLLTPYIFGAYDFELYQGFYVEAGVKHDFAIQDTGFTLTASADVAYVFSDRYFRKLPQFHDTGLQHYESGLTLSYDLNQPINIPRRYGQWSLKGFIFYTHSADKQLRGDTRLYGGGGIFFEY